MSIVYPELQALRDLIQTAEQMRSDEYRRKKDRESFIAQFMVIGAGTGGCIACGVLNYFLTVPK